MRWIWSAAQQTRQGRQRRRNEDAVLCRTPDRLWGVADGMGGLPDGALASRAVTAALARVPLQGGLPQRREAVQQALTEVNDALRLHARGHGWRAIGSTVVAVLADGPRAAVLWAGDSRLYRLRDGGLSQLTRDHDAGGGGGSHLISRAVGVWPQLRLEAREWSVEPRDVYLLCSDGLYRELPEAELCGLLAADEPTEAAEALLARCFTGTAADDASLVVLQARCC